MATTALGRLTLDLAVRLSDFSDGMSRAERETADATRNMSDSVTSFKDTVLDSLGGTPIGGAIDSLTSKLGSISDAFGSNGIAGAAKVGGLAIAGAMVGATGAIIALTIETAKADVQLERLAKRGNTTTQNLQVLTAATAKYGLEMEGVGDILADAQEKLGEFAATGGGGLTDTLDIIQKATKKTDEEMEAFGKTLSQMDSVDAIQAVVDELDKADASSQMVRFATESLASGLGDIIPLWDDNGRALRDLDRDLEQAGVIRTKESIEQTKFLASEVNNLKVEYEGLTNKVVSSTLPAMVGLAEYMQRGTEDADGLSDSMSSLGIMAAVITTPFIGFFSVLKQIGIVLAGLGVSVVSLFGLISDVLSNPFEIRTYLKEYLATTGNVGQYMIDDIVAEKNRAIGSIQTAFSSNRELANKRIAQNYTDTYGSSRSNTSFNSILNPNSANGGIPFKKGYTGTTAPYSDKALIDNTAAITASTTASKSNTKATGSATSASKANTARLVGISGNTGIGTGAHIDIRYASGDARRHQKPSLEHTNRFQVNGQPLGSLEKTSNFNLNRKHPVTGKVQPHYGVDYAAKVGSEITTTSPVKDVKKWYDKNGGGWVTTTTFEDGLIMNILHQDASIQSKVKSGSSSGSTGSSGSSGASKAASDAANAKREAERAEEARRVSGDNAVYQALNEAERIKANAIRERKEAKSLLFDRPNDLTKVLESINTKETRDLEELSEKILKPLKTREDEIESSYKDSIYEAARAYGEGSAEYIKATENAVLERDKNLERLREDTLLPFMSDIEKLDVQRKRDIADVEALHGAGSATANQVVAAIEANYLEAKAEIEWLMGEAERQKQILSNTIYQSMTDSVTSSAMSSEDSVARLNMLPEDYEEWRRSKDKSNDYDSLDTGYDNRENEINATDDKGNFLLDKERRDILLLEAHEEYLIRKQALDDSYAVKERDLAKDTAMAKLNLEQANVDAMGNLAGVLFGQQSSAARAAFLVSKAYTLQKILLDKGAAISSAWANTNGDIWMKAAAAAQAAIANGAAAEIVNQVVVPTLGGIAHGGMDYIPSESTYLLDKGERVLSPNQNKDLTNFLSKGGGSGGDTNISITIDNNGGSNMNSDNASEVSKNLSMQIKNIVEATLRKEKRQGGML